MNKNLSAGLAVRPFEPPMFPTRICRAKMNCAILIENTLDGKFTTKTAFGAESFADLDRLKKVWVIILALSGNDHLTTFFLTPGYFRKKVVGLDRFRREPICKFVMVKSRQPVFSIGNITDKLMLVK